MRIEDPATGRPLDVPISPWLNHLRNKGLKEWDSLLVGALRARGIHATADGEGTLRITGRGPAQLVWGVGVYLRALTVWRAAAPAGEDRGTRIPPDGTYITLTDPTPVPLTRTRGADIPVGTWLFQARHVGLTGLTDNEITQLEEAGLRVGEADSTDRRILQNPADPGAAAPTTTSTQHQPPDKEEELLTWIRTFLLPLGHDGKRLSDSRPPGTRLQKDTRSPDRDEKSKLRTWLHNASNASGRTASPRVRAALEAAAFTVEPLPDGKVRIGFSEDSDGRYQASREEVVNAIRDLLHPLNEDGNRAIDNNPPGTRPARYDKRFKIGRFDLAEWLQHASSVRGVKVWPETRAALVAAAFTLKPLPDTDGKVRVHFVEKGGAVTGSAPGGKAGTTAATAQGAGQEGWPEQSDQPGPRTAARSAKRRGGGKASEPRRGRARGTNTGPEVGQPPTHEHDPRERAGASDPANASATRAPAELVDRPEPGMPDTWAGPDAPARSRPATVASPDTFFPLLEDPGRALGSESTQPGVTSGPPAVPTHMENQPDQSGLPGLPGLPGPPDELAQFLGLDEPAQWFGSEQPAQWFGSEQPAGGWPDPGVAESWAGPDQEMDPFSLADIDWSAGGVGDALPGPDVGGPGDAVPVGVFDPLALGDPFLLGGPLTAAAEAGPLNWLGPEHSGESFMPWTGTGLPDTRADGVGLDRPQDGGPAGSTGAGVVPMVGGPVGDLSGGQWWNSAEQERQWRSVWKEETVDPSVRRAARDLGWTVWQVPPDGDCFFHALIAAGQAADHTPLPESVMVIRAELADEVERVRNILLWTGALPPRQRDDQAEPWWSTVQQSVINILAREAALAVLRPDLFSDPAQSTDAGRPRPSVEEIEQSDAFQDLVQAFTALRADTGVLPEDWQSIADQFRTPGRWNNVSGDIAPVIAAHLYGIHLHTLQIDPRGTNWTLTVGPTHGQPLHLVRHAHHWMPARHHTSTTPQPAPAHPHPADPPLPADTPAATHQPPPHQIQNQNQRQRVENTPQDRPKQRKSPTQWTDDLILDAIDTWRHNEHPDEEDCTQIPPGEATVRVRIPNTDRYEDVRIGAKMNKLISVGVKSASRRLVEGMEKRHIHMEEVDGFHRVVRGAGQRYRSEWSIEQFVAGLVHWRNMAGPNGEDRSNVLPNQKAEVVLAVSGSDTRSAVPIGYILYAMLRGLKRLTEADIALLRQHGIHLSEPDNDGRRRVLQDPAQTASGGMTGPDQQPAAETGRPGITTSEQEQQQGTARDAATWEYADEAARQDLEGFGDRPAAHPAAGRTHEGEESRTRTVGIPSADGPSPHTPPRAAADTAPPAGMPADAGTAKHQAMSVEDDIMAQMMGWT